MCVVPCHTGICMPHDLGNDLDGKTFVQQVTARGMTAKVRMEGFLYPAQVADFFQIAVVSLVGDDGEAEVVFPGDVNGIFEQDGAEQYFRFGATFFNVYLTKLVLLEIFGYQRSHVAVGKRGKTLEQKQILDPFQPLIWHSFLAEGIDFLGAEKVNLLSLLSDVNALERVNGNSLDIHAEKDDAPEFGKHIGCSGISEV